MCVRVVVVAGRVGYAVIGADVCAITIIVVCILGDTYVGIVVVVVCVDVIVVVVVY